MSSTFETHALHPVDLKPGIEVQVWGAGKEPYDVSTPHRHDYYEVLFFLKGGAKHDIDFTTFDVSGPQAHFVCCNAVHLMLREPSAEGFSLMFGREYFSQELIGHLPFSRPRPVLNLTPEELAGLHAQALNICEELKSQAMGYHEVVKALATTMLIRLSRIAEQLQPVTGQFIQKPDLVTTFLELTEQYYKTHRKVEDYADDLHVSVKHLISVVKTHTGRTPLQLLTGRLVAEAKRMLFHTTLSVKEIGFELGFNDPTNFSKHFRNSTGYSPVEYREGIR